MVNFSTGSVYGSTDGAALLRVQVHGFREKRAAIQRIMARAEAAGARASLRTRIQVVADELIMNALYRAPTDAQGQGRFQNAGPGALAALSELDAVEIQCCQLGERFAICVRDQAGSLQHTLALRLLEAAMAGPSEVGDCGVGLGLVVASASLVDFYLNPGHSTEVVALFDLQSPGFPAGGAHTLRIFTSGQPTHVLRAPSRVGPAPFPDDVVAKLKPQESKKAVRTHAPQR